MSPPSIKLTYFDIEAAAEPVRLAFCLTKTPYEDNRIQFSEWGTLKPTTPYGQLPLLQVDNGPIQTQSQAMLRWVGSKFTTETNLYPSDKLFAVEEALGIVGDFKEAWSRPMYLGMNAESFGHPEGFTKTAEGKALVKKMREAFVAEKMGLFCTRLTDLMDKNGGKWLVAGDGPSLADCAAIPLLRSFTCGHIDHVPTDCLDKYPKIVDYIKRFCALDGVKGRYTNGTH